jgi:hypothetical protein
MWEKKRACKYTVGEPLAKRWLGRPRIMWENNIKANIKEIADHSGRALSSLARMLGL